MMISLITKSTLNQGESAEPASADQQRQYQKNPFASFKMGNGIIPKPILNQANEFKGESTECTLVHEYRRDPQNSFVSFKMGNGIRRIFLCFIVFCILFTVQTSYAFNVSAEDLKNPDSKFFRYVNAYIVSSALYQEALKINENMHFTCAEEYHILPGDVTILQPIIFDDKFQHPISGLWLHRYRVQRCGREIIYNTYIASQNGSPPKIISGVNGLTNVSLKYLLDVIISVYKYANSQYAPCPEGSTNPAPFVYDTELNTDTNPSNQKWSEKWLVGICNTMITINIDFDNRGKEMKYTLNTPK